MTKTIRHTLPGIGRVEVQVYGFASEILSSFEEVNEITRLKGLSQLGALRLIYPQAHHTRWDYIVLHLHLLKLMADYGKIGLTSEFNIGNIKCSRIELVQSYIFLRHFGHLFGTLHSEKILLSQIIQNQNLKNIFIKNLPTKKFQKYAKQLIKNENIFDFHILLSAYLLKNGLDRNLGPIRNKSIQFLTKLAIAEDEATFFIKKIHDESKKLAYLAIDTQYAGLEINMNLSSLLIRPERIATELFWRNKSGLQETLKFLSEYLVEELYQSHDAYWAGICFKELYYKNKFLRFEKVVTKNDFTRAIRKIRRSGRPIQAKERPLFFQVRTAPVINFDKNRNRWISRERDLKDIANVGSDKFALSNDGEKAFIFLSTDNFLEFNKLFSGLIKILCWRRNLKLPVAIKRQHRNLFKTMDAYNRETATFLWIVLAWITKNQYEIVLNDLHAPRETYPDSAYYSSKLNEAKNNINLFHKNSIKHINDKDRMHEIKFMKYFIDKNKVTGHTIIFPHRIFFQKKSVPLYPEYKHKNREISEFDGGIINFNRGILSIYLFEAKNTGNASSLAEKDLRNKKKKLRFRKGAVLSINKVRNYGAYLKITTQ